MPAPGPDDAEALVEDVARVVLGEADQVRLQEAAGQGEDDQRRGQPDPGARVGRPHQEAAHRGPPRVPRHLRQPRRREPRRARDDERPALAEQVPERAVVDARRVAGGVAKAVEDGHTVEAADGGAEGDEPAARGGPVPQRQPGPEPEERRQRRQVQEARDADEEHQRQGGGGQGHQGGGGRGGRRPPGAAECPRQVVEPQGREREGHRFRDGKPAEEDMEGVGRGEHPGRERGPARPRQLEREQGQAEHPEEAEEASGPGSGPCRRTASANVAIHSGCRW